MDRPRWNEIDKLLDTALELEPEKRKAFLDEACAGDPSLRKEIEALLAADEKARTFIEEPALVKHRGLLPEDVSEPFGSSFPFTFAHYLVLRRIGEGGMGKVYLAEDQRLSRKVALKILRPEFTRDPSRLQRFENEARAASALNHPNILTVHEIGREGQARFMATEFVEGETLRAVLSTCKIPIREAIEIAIQAASALAAAHAAGIVHRDIKPENIMLRPDGYVKVVDFGVAKITQPTDSGADEQSMTKEGEIIGTVKYMSPEQVRGLSIDARSDIFSLGVVLFEMVTGVVPFEGATRSDVMVSILERDAFPVRNYAPGAPKELESIVMKSLQKNAQDRYQTAAAMLDDLRQLKKKLEFSQDDRANQWFKVGPFQIPGTRWRPITFVLAAIAIILMFLFVLDKVRQTPPEIKSIAVLPLTNVNQDPEMDYLTDGMTETIIRSLSRLRDLEVMSRSTVFRYKGREVDPQTVGKELGVSAVLTGSVTNEGDDLLIRLDLADAHNNSAMWSHQYRGKASSLISIQSEIAMDIFTQLHTAATGDERSTIGENYTDNPEAYRLYLKGRYFWNKRTKEGLEKALLYFHQALETDPSYSLAWSGVADCYISRAFYSYAPPKDALPKAKAAAIKALEIDPSLAEAHVTLGHVAANFDWDWKTSEKEFKSGIQLNPNYSTGHQWYAIHYLIPLRRLDDALTELRLAQQLDPLSPLMTTFLGEALYFSRCYKEAEKECLQALELEPDFPVAHWHLGLIYQQQGLYDEALSEHRKAVELSGGSPRLKAALGQALATAGRRDEALQVLSQLQQGGYVSSLEVASIHLALGDKEQAFDFLEKAYEERSFHLTYLKVRPDFDSIRGDPRFESLTLRIGLQTP